MSEMSIKKQTNSNTGKNNFLRKMIMEPSQVDYRLFTLQNQMEAIRQRNWADKHEDQEELF